VNEKAVSLEYQEVHMKKIILLAGIAAAVFGAKKLLGGKADETDLYGTTPEPTPANGYAPQPQ
jgi:hypothetical protein